LFRFTIGFLIHGGDGLRLIGSSRHLLPRLNFDSAKRENFCGGWDFHKAQAFHNRHSYEKVPRFDRRVEKLGLYKDLEGKWFPNEMLRLKSEERRNHPYRR